MTRGRKQELSPGTSPVHFFGSEVRRAREEAGMTQGGLAAIVPCDPSTVSRIEAGALAADRRFADACDEAFPEMRGWFGRFYTGSRDWNSPFATPFRPFAQYEATATAIYTLEHSLIPGLLQTEDYAHALLSRHPSASDGEVAERVWARMARQEVLTGDDPPMLWAVVDEGVLSRCIGGAKTMYEALRHLAAMAALPNVVVQVIAGTVAHVGLQGSVTIAENAGTGTTASIEDIADGRLAEDSPTITRLMTRVRWLQAEALPASASRELIGQIMEEKWKQDG
jgi:hypothetical protein